MFVPLVAILWAFPLLDGRVSSVSSPAVHALRTKSLGLAVKGISLQLTGSVLEETWFVLAESPWLFEGDKLGCPLVLAWSLMWNMSRINSCSIPVSSPSTSLLWLASLTKKILSLPPIRVIIFWNSLSSSAIVSSMEAASAILAQSRLRGSPLSTMNHQAIQYHLPDRWSAENFLCHQVRHQGGWE